MRPSSRRCLSKWGSTVLAAELALGQDDLDRWQVLGSGDGVVEDADDPDDLLNELDPVLESALLGIGGIADQSIALGNPLRSLDSNNLAIFEEHLIDVGVQHECTTVDCADPGESLGDAAQSEDGVDEGTGVFAHGVHVELDLADEVDGWSVEEVVVGVESDCVTDEVDSVLLQLILGQHFLGRSVELDTSMGLGIVFLEVLNSLQELLASPLLEEPHQIRSKCLLGRDRHFEDLESSLREESSLLILEYIGAVDG